MTFFRDYKELQDRRQQLLYDRHDTPLQLVSLLADHGFDGFVVSEVDAPFQNHHELQMDVLLFERWLELRNEDSSALHTTSQPAR